MRKSYCGLLFCVLVTLFATDSLLPAKATTAESAEVCATLTTADHERDWFQERTTHTALLPEVRINAAPISRTSFGRQRTLTRVIHHWAEPKVVPGLPLAHTFEHYSHARGNFSLAKAYYIYALRHIII